MFNLKNLKYFLSVTVVLSMLLSSQTFPTQAQNNSPSAGQAGVRSGTPPAHNNTVFGVPPTTNVTNSTSNVTVSPGPQGQTTISVPTNVLANVNNTASVTITRFQRGTNSQREIAQIARSVSQGLRTSLGNGRLDKDPILVEIVTITPNPDGSSSSSTSSRRISNFNELSRFIKSTIGTTSTGQILIGGLTITLE